MISRPCEGCGKKPQAYHGRRWCYDCKPGCGGRPLPCKRCGASGDYWSEGLCRRCHQYAPQRPEPCRDCLAWGVRRTQKWLCGGCLSWRYLHPTAQPCASCQRELSVNEHGVCRLCWKQTKLLQDRLPYRHRGALNIAEANRHGQQLFLANMASSKNGHRTHAVQDDPPASATTATPWQQAQLSLFRPDPIRDAARRYGFGDPPDSTAAELLDQSALDHAARHGWTVSKTRQARTAIRVLLAMRTKTREPIAVSEVLGLYALGVTTSPVLAVLAGAGQLLEDRPAPLHTWFSERTRDLPEHMAGELNIWFQVLSHGSNTPPRSRPRSPITIRTRLLWTLPTLHLWAAAGHSSLREISRDDVLLALPASGTPRVKLGYGLRSIFGTLKAHHVLFVNPIARLELGNFERRTPLPVDPVRLRAALDSTDPSTAALAALIAFHGLRPVELRELRLTDVADGRLTLPDRVLPLAQPVLARLAAYRDYRHTRWPDSINPYFFIHLHSAGTTDPVRRHWVNSRLGMPAQAIRADRIVDEVHATAGDLRRICDFFGVTMTTAEHYASSLTHPALDHLGHDNKHASY